MPFFIHLILLLLPSPALLSNSNGAPHLPTSQRVSREAKPIKVLISEPCLQGSEPCEPSEAKGKQVELEPGAPLVLTHRIRLLQDSGSSCGGCEADFAALRARIERLEKEVSELREKCGGPEDGCCTSQQSKGAGCTTVRPPTDECPDDCSDQGRCVDGKCECFPGFSGPDCSESDCPGNCNDKGKCVNGQCVCDPGFTGPDCSQVACPGNCNNRGKCVNGQCVCDPGFSGPDCTAKACPKNCSKRGRCVNGKCVCDTGFTGPDCSARACPGNCSKRGRCVNGKCVCESGFTGPDCSERSCPGNCNNKGRCVNGKCVCESGFTGPDCSERSCPGNCNNKGRCVNGKCVCESGFTGPDCSERSCPGNCNNKGRCVDGRCECNPGFSGPDCSVKTCPENCNNRGRCVNGKCVCESGFTGPDCSTKTCPNNCDGRGQCVDGRCVCDAGFSGPDCSTKSCPNDCNNKGRCVNGKCVCDVGFTGQDCSTKTCPNNCSNRGRCVNGRCVCRRGFAGPDCSECDAGFTGPDCATALTGVSRLSTKEVTESSVTLFWTPPAVQYDTYHITFTSKKESEKITSKVSGRLTTYTQVGLAAGQEYTVTIIGEKDGKTGPESKTEFQTLISGPKDLQVVKTSTTSVIVQWDQALGEIDRYILYVSPNQTDGSGRGSQEIKLPSERDSAQIDGLEPGRLYDISLIAEKDGARSLPATVQATPGMVTKTLPRMTVETVTMKAASGSDSSGGKIVEAKPDRTTLSLQNKGPSKTGPRKPFRAQDPGTSKNIYIPIVNMPTQTDQSISIQPEQTRPAPEEKEKVLLRPNSRPNIIRRPNVGMLRFNGTRIGNGGGRISPYPLRKPTGRYPAEGPKAKTPSLGSGPLHPFTKNTTLALVMKDTSDETSSKESVDKSHPRMGQVRQVGNKDTPSSVLQYTQISSDSQGRTDSMKVPESSQKISKLSEDPLEPTITTEKNLTVHINGTKCVRRILVGHKKIHFNGTSNGSALTKNMSVVVGHVNGNAVLHNYLTSQFGGFSDKVVAVTGKTTHPQPDEIEHKGGKEEAGEDEDTSVKPTNFPPETFSETFMRVNTQKQEAGTSLPERHSTLPPLLPLAIPQPTLLPSETQDGHSNAKKQLRDRHLTGTSSKISLSSRNRYPLRPRPPGSSTPVIRRRPILSAASSQILKDRYAVQNGSSAPGSHLVATKQEVLESKAMASQQSDPGRQYLLMESVQGHSAAPLLPELPATDTVKTDGKIINDTLETKARNGTPFRRTPLRGPFPRKPNFGPFQNRTRPLLNPPQHPYRSSLMRPILTRFPNKDNSTGRQTVQIPNNQIKPDINSSSQNGINSKPRPAFPARRKNGTGIRLPPVLHRPIKPNGTNIQNGPTDNKQGIGDHDSKVSLSLDKDTNKDSNVIHTTGKPASKTNELSTTGDSKSSIDHVVPGITNEEGNTLEQTVPHVQVKPEIIGSSDNSTNINRRPTFPVRRTNGAAIRFQPKRVQIKPNTTIIHEGPKGNKESTVLKDSKAGFSVNEHAGKESTPGKDANQEFNIAVPSNKTAGIPKETSHLTGDSEDGIDHVGVQNVTSKGFIIIWGAPSGMFQYFVISMKEHPAQGSAGQENEEDEDHKQEEGVEEEKVSDSIRQEEADGRNDENKDNLSEESLNALGIITPNSYTVRRNSSYGEVIKKFTKILAGSARSYPVANLAPQTGYSVSLIGKGPGLRSNTHNLIISTGPEPPSNLGFSEITESSLTVSWTKPKSPVSGFKVTYTQMKDGEPVSVLVDSTDSTVGLSKLSPGSSYEVSVISVLGLDESDPINDIVLTLPDPPTDLRAINVTDTKALLLWRPALATIDQYIIVYGSEEAPGSELTIKVSGNAAEQQLQALKASTKYTVTIVSQLGDRRSSGATTTFITTSGSGGRGEGPRDLKASQVTPRTAVLSWKPPASAVTSYKLTYFTESQEMKEVIIDSGVTEYKLTGLHPSSTYTARLQGQRGGLYTTAISTQFTTGSLRFPFPTDCSQELLNGVRESGVVEIFPGGKNDKPVTVYCDMETDGGGWTVFQRRNNGKTNFFRGWQEYSKGFGELEGEFWLGNALLHNLTQMSPMTLRVDLRSGDEHVYALYSSFSVDTMKKHYMLRISGYSGTAGDSMKYHDKRPFSTRDRDPQPFITRCAMSYRGGWWYKNCHEANLNGLYNTHTNHQGVIWTAWKGKDFSIPFAEMKLRPTSFNPRT